MTRVNEVNDPPLSDSYRLILSFSSVESDKGRSLTPLTILLFSTGCASSPLGMACAATGAASQLRANFDPVATSGQVGLCRNFAGPSHGGTVGGSEDREGPPWANKLKDGFCRVRI